MRITGFIIRLTDVTARIGIITEAIAVLDVTSVNNETSIATNRMMNSTSSMDRRVRCFTSSSAKPDLINPLERQIPPPKRRRTPQGIFSTDSQSMVYCRFLMLTGRRKSRIAPNMAIVESSMPGNRISRPGIVMSPIFFVPEKIHMRAVMTKTIRVHRSPGVIRPSFFSSSVIISRL